MRYTDLANESYRLFQNVGLPGITYEKESCGDDIIIEKIEITDDNAAQKIGKNKGRYISINSEYAQNRDIAHHRRLGRALGEQIRGLLPPDGELTMVVGLGNRAMTPDALGPKTLEKIMVTKHLKEMFPHLTDERLSAVCTFLPSVLGLTGIESADSVQAVCRAVKPSCVIAVDSLAAAEACRINDTIQLSDTGIAPGAGVGNRRRGLNRQTLGVPVLAVGIPVVVRLGELTAEDGEYRDMIVTPKNIDSIINDCSGIIAYGINTALHRNITAEEIADFMY